MTLQLELVKRGNSAHILIPSYALKQLNLSVGDMVNVEIMGKQELDNYNEMNLRKE
jgi:antitoxin component of MazEF toxin-antitoxin module